MFLSRLARAARMLVPPESAIFKFVDLKATFPKAKKKSALTLCKVRVRVSVSLARKLQVLCLQATIQARAEALACHVHPLLLVILEGLLERGVFCLEAQSRPPGSTGPDGLSSGLP